MACTVKEGRVFVCSEWNFDQGDTSNPVRYCFCSISTGPTADQVRQYSSLFTLGFRLAESILENTSSDEQGPNPTQVGIPS